MALSKKNAPGCASNPAGCGCGGGCLVTLTVNARCSGVGVAGTLIELLDAAGTIVLQSCTGSSCVFTSVDGTLAHNVRVSKTGYCTKTYSVAALGCAGPYTYNAAFWPSSYTLPVQVNYSNSCPADGAVVLITGGGTGTATANSSGVANVTVSTNCTTPSPLSLSVTPPAGHGAQGQIDSFSVDPCNPPSKTYALGPDASHFGPLCGSYYTPLTMSYSDDYGTCTLNWGAGPIWFGGYTYVSNNSVASFNCPPVGLIIDQTSTIPVSIEVRPGTFSGCGTPVTWKVTRIVSYLTAGDCAGAVTKCQPTAGVGDIGYTNPDSYANTSCPSGVGTITGTNGPVAAVACATYEESSVTFTVTWTT